MNCVEDEQEIAYNMLHLAKQNLLDNAGKFKIAA